MSCSHPLFRVMYVMALPVCFAQSSLAQEYPQLRLKFGATRAFSSSSGNNFYRMLDKHSPLPSGIGLEYQRPMKKPGQHFFAGAFLHLQPYVVGINPARFTTVPGAGDMSSGYGNIRVYAGWEKRLGKMDIPAHRNYFSVFGSLGLAWNPGSQNTDSWFGTTIGDGLTTDGRIFRGEYFDGRGYPEFAGYYSKLRQRPAHALTPVLSAGLRWNIRNKKGNTCLVTELSFNYNPVSVYYLDISYTLDGQPAMDRLKERGSSIQLNLLIPLKTFRKKKGVDPD